MKELSNLWIRVTPFILLVIVFVAVVWGVMSPPNSGVANRTSPEASAVAAAPTNTPSQSKSTMTPTKPLQTLPPISTSTPTATSTDTPIPPTETPEPPTDTPTLPADTPTPPEVAPTSAGLLLEDFETDRRGQWFSPDAHVFSYSETTQQVHGGNRSFIVTANKDNTFQFVGVELQPEVRDFSNYNRLEFWVYGQVELLVKLEDEDLQAMELGSQSTNDPAGWNLLSFDISQMPINRSKVKTVLFFPAPGTPNGSITFFLDDLYLK